MCYFNLEFFFYYFFLRKEDSRFGLFIFQGKKKLKFGSGNMPRKVIVFVVGIYKHD